jgi:hypothetical protein
MRRQPSCKPRRPPLGFEPRPCTPIHPSPAGPGLKERWTRTSVGRVARSILLSYGGFCRQARASSTKVSWLASSERSVAPTSAACATIAL